MIPNKIRESRRVKALKLPKNLERLYKEGKCRECAVVVTRMDFAKILGKFTKVKIQYESSTTPKTKQNSEKTEITSPNSNARLKSNENGMVLIHRNAYSQHPVKELAATKKSKSENARLTPNILKENNRLKKPLLKDKNANYDDKKKKSKTNLKQYGIVFEDPLAHNPNNEINCKITLTDLLSQINESILPSDDWCIDFFPKKGEPKDDKVYDRIAAELEDLMYSEKPAKPEDKTDNTETKVDDFPSIMDILNDNSNENKTNDQSSNLEFKSNLESSDVEAMLLGKPNPTSDPVPPTPMDVDNPDMSNLIEDVNQFTVIQENIITEQDDKIPATDMTEDIENPSNVTVEIDNPSEVTEDTKKPSDMTKESDNPSDVTQDIANPIGMIEEIENPHSPSILDEALQKGIEEHLPCNTEKQTEELETSQVKTDEKSSDETKQAETTETKVEEIETKVILTIIDNKINESKDIKIKEPISFASIEGITHLVFKKTKDGDSLKIVTCPKNLRYDIEIDGKSVEFIGAPKFISSIEDLQVLLQIVNESELDSLYVLH